MRLISCTFLLTLLLVGCKEGELAETAVVQSFSQESLSLTDYSATHMQILLKGSVLAEGIESFHELVFFDNSACSGTSMGQATAKLTQQSGVLLNVPIQEELLLYYRTNTNDVCHYALTYNISLDPVPAPSLTRTIPESPARQTNTIAILGQAFPSQGTVELYTDSLCTSPVSSGSSANFSQPGLLLTVPSDTVIPISARMKDPRGKYSKCQLLSEYEHRSDLLTAVEFLSSTPLSPSSSVYNPIITGRTQTGIVNVTLYSDAACSASLGQIDSTSFESIGLEVNLPLNTTSNIYGRGLSNNGDWTPCFFLTEYIHDSIAPGPPVFGSASPITPTKVTTFPQIIGSAPADSAVVRLFSDPLCNQVIGFGSTASFATTGVTANLPANNTTSIYATSLDSSGNESGCTYFLDYKHNTIAPQPPFFQTSTPTSPTNQSDDPTIFGTPSQFTWEMYFYDDITCTNLVGQGTPAEFSGVGITVDLQPNTNNFIYSIVRDFEGNYSDCTELTTFDHSNLPAPNPVFTTAYPSSPTRLTTTPAVSGTAATIVTTIKLYLDGTCSTQVSSGSRGNFQAAGVPVTVNANAVTPVYAMSQDIYGNDSTCQLLTNYTHSNIPPLDPTYSSVNPASPNNVSFTPNIFGNAFTNIASPIDPVNVVFSDNPSCVGSLGSGTPAEFSSTGIQINVAPNAPSSIYARSFDAAGNGSNCTLLTGYIHNTLQPGRPLLSTMNPATPSYTPLTQVTGSFAASSDFMSRVSVSFYSDLSCSNEILTTTPNIYQTTGIDIPLPPNSITPLSAASFNGVGNKSQCSLLVNFNTYDTAPSGLSLSQNLNGSVNVFWLVDSVASPQANYRLKRATQAGGPYTTLYSGVSNSFQDRQITEGSTYYYVVQATNSTGQTINSAEGSITVDAPAPVAAASLIAVPSHISTTLTWSGFPQNLSYNVYRATASGGPYLNISSGLQNSSYTDFGLTNDQVYFYIVKGFNPEGESVSSNEARVVPRAIPLAPANLWLKPMNSIPECSGNAGVWVQWTEPTHFDNFRLRRRDSGGGNTFTNVASSFYVDCSSIGNSTIEYDVASRWGSYVSGFSTSAVFEQGQSSLFVYPGDGEINLQWNAPGLADTINIYRSSSANGPFALYTSQANTGSFLDTGVVNGQGYFYTIQAMEGANIYQGLPSNIQSGVPGTGPAAPTNLVAEMSSAFLNLSWSKPTHFNEFFIYRAPAPGGPFSQIGKTTLGSFSDFIPLEGMNYYRVTAKWGTSETAASNTVAIRKAKVVNLVAIGSASNIQLNWDNYATATTYRVERSASSKGPWSTLALPATNSYADSSAVSGESYYYRVKPQFADTTEGQVSLVVSSKRTDSSIPGGLSITSQSAGALGVAWVPVAGATSYDVEIATNLGGPYTLVSTSALTTANISGLTARTQYFIRVTSLVGATSFVSTPIAAATLNQVTAPTGSAGNNLVDLQWVSSIGVTSYTLERSTDGINFSSLVTGLATASYTDNTAVNGQIYFYKVIHIFSGVGSVTSPTSASVTPGVTPLAPQGLSVVDNSTGNEVSLAWARSTNATLYGVYRATNLGGPYTPLFNTSGFQNVSVSGLTSGTRYYFQVTALNGTLESVPSSILSVRPMATPNAPTVNYVSSTEIQMDWTPVTNADTYDILRSDDRYNFHVIATGVAVTDYLDTSADPNYTYYYKYQPIASTGELLPLSAASDLIGTGTTINTPLGVTITADGIPEVLLTWAPVSQAETYEIHRSLTSGGGYSLLGTVAANLTSWTDSTVVSSQTYFYKIRALNHFTAPSAFSSEVNITLVAPPAGVTAANNGPDIDISWSSVAGATQYLVFRSQDINGNYGYLGTSAVLNFSDSTGVPGQTYHYKVAAALAGPIYTPLSTEATVIKTGSMNLSFPVELLDRPVSSSGSQSIAFERTTTTFDTQEYDGTVTYAFEIVAQNIDGSPININLVDSGDNNLVSLAIPANTTNPTRFLQAFTPNTGFQKWRLELEQTAFDNDVIVSQARVIVYQVNASRTAIYVPLLSSAQGSSIEDFDGFVAQSEDSSENVLLESLPYIRQVAELQELNPLNPWSLEVIVASEPGVTGEVAFYNIDQDEAVASTITEFDQSVPTVVRIPMSNNLDNFDADNEDEAFGISLRCQLGCHSGINARVYKAGLWIRLQNLRKTQVTWRTSLAYAVQAVSSAFDQQRTFLNLNDYNNTQVFWQVSMNSDQEVKLANASTADSGTGALVDVAGSSLTGSGSGFEEILRSGSLTLNSGDRYLLISNPASPFPLSGSQIIINNEL